MISYYPAENCFISTCKEVSLSPLFQAKEIEKISAHLRCKLVSFCSSSAIEAAKFQTYPRAQRERSFTVNFFVPSFSYARVHAQFINHQDGKQNSEPEYYFSQKELKYITGKIITKYKLPLNARCMKITEKVTFNIVSEANYVYILSGH